jgi:hypothetical protein
MRKLTVFFFMLIMITTSVVSAQESQTVSFRGDGDAVILQRDCDLPSGPGLEDDSYIDPYLGIKSVVGSVATLPCTGKNQADCPHGYKIMANIQIDRGCGPQFSTSGPTPIQNPALEYVDCDAQEDENGFATIASFIVLGPEGDPSRLVEIGRVQYPGTNQEDSGYVRVKLRVFGVFGEWICYRQYGIDYLGRSITCR